MTRRLALAGGGLLGLSVVIAFVACVLLLIGVRGGAACGEVRVIYLGLGLYLLAAGGVRAFLIYGTQQGRALRVRRIERAGRVVDIVSALHLVFAFVPLVAFGVTRC